MIVDQRRVLTYADDGWICEIMPDGSQRRFTEVDMEEYRKRKTVAVVNANRLTQLERVAEVAGLYIAAQDRLRRCVTFNATYDAPHATVVKDAEIDLRQALADMEVGGDG